MRLQRCNPLAEGSDFRCNDRNRLQKLLLNAVQIIERNSSRFDDLCVDQGDDLHVRHEPEQSPDLAARQA